jgi:hypothetical protein
MPGTSAAKAKNKVQYVPDAIIAIVDGQPVPPDVFIKPNGTVQFVNTDDVSYRVRLFTRDHKGHADVDLFLPVRDSVTVIAPSEGECRYEVLDATTLASRKLDAATLTTGKRNGGGTLSTGGGSTGVVAASASKSGGGGGGTIKIGPN